MPNNHFSLFKTFVDRERGVALLLNPNVLGIDRQTLLAA